MSKLTTAIIFEGGQPACAVAQLMLTVRYATCLDMIEKLKSLPHLFERVILATNYPDLAKQAEDLGVIIYPTLTEDFDFGGTLKHIISSFNVEKALYISGAGSPVMTALEFASIATTLNESDDLVYVNNVQSADIVGWVPANRLLNIESEMRDDNSLGYILRRDGQLHRRLMPHSVGVHFDIDTPTDILMAKLLRLGGERTLAALDALPANWNLEPYERVQNILAQRDFVPGLWMSGRIGGPVIQQINTFILARLRVMSEERGMKSMGKEQQVNSFVGSFIAEAGISAFFKYLEQSVHVALIDTRPLFMHFKQAQTEHDRFMSDLGLWQEIEEEWIRDFTRAATECSIPVILGGHTLILGGIWALSEDIHHKREERREENRSKRNNVE